MRFDNPWDAVYAQILPQSPPPAPKASPSYYIIDLTAHQLVKDMSGYPRSYSARYLAENEATRQAGLATGTKRFLVVKGVVEIESKKTTVQTSKEFA